MHHSFPHLHQKGFQNNTVLEASWILGKETGRIERAPQGFFLKDATNLGANRINVFEEWDKFLGAKVREIAWNLSRFQLQPPLPERINGDVVNRLDTSHISYRPIWQGYSSGLSQFHYWYIVPRISLPISFCDVLPLVHNFCRKRVWEEQPPVTQINCKTLVHYEPTRDKGSILTGLRELS